MKVAKFGGSSLSNAAQIKKVSEIIKNDQGIRFVVVSAPGKQNDEDTKVTDLLIALHANKMKGLDIEPIIQKILNRYQEIIDGLDLDKGILVQFGQTLRQYLESIQEPAYLLDALKSCGEDFNARIVNAYLNTVGVASSYMSPLDAGFTMTNNPGNARLIPTSYQEIKQLRGRKEVLVIPGFFGYTEAGDIVTFSRGGSDITGAIVARGVNADVYENYTDVSNIYAAHPGIVKNPHPISEITYREIRELSYSGFNVFHDEALQPLYEVKIPVIIKNTNRPQDKGTRIVSTRDDVNQLPVVGLSGDTGFLSITIKRYLLNREMGVLRRLLETFETFDLSIEHVPTGIDDVSIILRSDQFEGNNKLQQIQTTIQKEFNPEWIHVEEDLAIIAVVGEGMRDTIGIANKATEGFKRAGVNLRMINQGASETSMFFSISGEQLNKSIRYLYNEYFE